MISPVSDSATNPVLVCTHTVCNGCKPMIVAAMPAGFGHNLNWVINADNMITLSSMKECHAQIAVILKVSIGIDCSQRAQALLSRLDANLVERSELD